MKCTFSQAASRQGQAEQFSRTRQTFVTTTYIPILWTQHCVVWQNAAFEWSPCVCIDLIIASCFIKPSRHLLNPTRESHAQSLSLWELFHSNHFFVTKLVICDRVDWLTATHHRLTWLQHLQLVSEDPNALLITIHFTFHTFYNDLVDSELIEVSQSDVPGAFRGNIIASCLDVGVNSSLCINTRD